MVEQGPYKTEVPGSNPGSRTKCAVSSVGRALLLHSRGRRFEPYTAHKTMKNIAPNIMRKRLLVEAKYAIEVSEQKIKDFLVQLPQTLGLRIYANPIIHNADGLGKIENSGYDAFVPLIDSGIYIGIWTKQKFLSCVIYTCADFSTPEAHNFIKKFFQATEVEFMEF